MAATRLIAMHVQKNRSVQQCLKDRTDYAENGEKTENGEYISFYECDPETVDEEFAFSKSRYGQFTGRSRDDDIISKGKGPGYERWAKIHNIKQISQTLIYLRDHDIRDMDELTKRASDSATRFAELSQTIKDAEKRMAEIAVLKTHIINYSKTKDVYVAYRKAGYSKQFFEAHREEILLHKAAKEAFGLLEGGVPKPKLLIRSIRRF